MQSYAPSQNVTFVKVPVLEGTWEPLQPQTVFRRKMVAKEIYTPLPSGGSWLAA
jgi:hypothetical protein